MTLALAAPLVLFAAAAAAAPSQGSGTVSYVTAKEGYLDVGRDDGVTSGAKLKVLRRKKAVGICEVVEVSATRARCASDRVAAGDRVSFAIVPPEPEPTTATVEPKIREPMPSAKELAEQRALVQSAPIERVAHKKGSSVLLSTARASTTLRQEVWAISTAPEGVFGRSSLDASARANLGFYPAAFTAGSLRIVGDFIAPPDQRALNVYVWNVSVGVDDGPVVGQVGRFRPRKAPGALLLDGAQVGARVLGGTTEIGGFAGAVPDLFTTAPALDRLTAGAYVGLDLAAAPGVLALPRASASIIATPDFASVRAELAAQAQVFWASVGSVGASFRTGIGGTEELVATIDAASLDADFTAIEALRLSGGYRYFGPVADFDAISAIAPVGGAHHASATTAYVVAPWLVLGATSGAGYDNVAGTVRGYAGPELGLPQALGPVGGLAFGYLEELGDWPGRSAWLSANAAQVGLMSVVTRLSLFETAALDDSYREAALMVLTDAPVLPWLSIRGRGYLQQALPEVSGAARSTPTLLMVDLSITGSL